jgi:DNA processing protein
MAGVEDAAWWVALRATPGIGDVVGRRLCERFGGPCEVLAVTPEDLVAAGCPAAAAGELGRAATLRAAEREVARIRDAGARVVGLAAAEYPALLRELYDAPLYLIAKGRPLTAEPAVAIVGARRATPYGLAIARQLAEGLAHAGVAVVSGLARGIDGAAHEGALAARGSTFAVLGSGIDVIYPREHAELAERIVAGGTLLSERPVGTAPLAGHFPARNRILAGMSRGTVVIEAAERSGSLITARLANESGREVFAVPGRVDSPLSHGAHLLIREGATLVRAVDDVLDEIVPALRARALLEASSAGAPSGTVADVGRVTALVLEALAAGPASVDEIIEASGLSASEILASVLDLELRGVLREVAGRQFQLTGRFAGVSGLQ